MDIATELIYRKLGEAGIFGPDSKELQQQESYLTRYFEREYQRCIDSPQSLQALGISTHEGPMMEETEALMENHYDEKPEFFSSFLDTRYRAYSMAYYGETPEQICSSTATLEEAQHAKFSLIAHRAGIEGYERIFNIGCGFGSLETYLLDNFPNIEIVGITPSKIQISYIRQRMQDPADPLACGRFKLITDEFDYISKKNKLGKFDLVISIGVLEHCHNMRLLLRRIRQFLKPSGTTFHHFITSKFIIPQFLHSEKTRIGVYFPGGRIWPQDELAHHTEHFDLDKQWYINGLNYWRTLAEWHRRYWKGVPRFLETANDIKTINHWNDYFTLCKSVFPPMNGHIYGNSQYLFKLRD